MAICCSSSVCQRSSSSVIPLNVLPTITNPSSPRAPRWRLDSQPWRRPWPHSAARTTRSNVCTGLTLRHAPPRRPAAYGDERSLTITPSRPRADGVVHERGRLVGVGGDDRGQAERRRHQLVEHVSARRQRLVDEGVAAGVDARRRSRPPARRRDPPRPGRRSRPSCPGTVAARPSSVSPATSPSRTRSPPGRPATSATTPGRRSVISLRLRVNRRTSPSRRCAWTRAPSSFHSTDAAPVSASASATPSAGEASIGPTARPGDEGDRPQRVDTAGERLQGGLAEIAGEHVGAADLVDGNAGPAGDGLDHHALQRTLAQLTAEDAPQQPLLDRRRPGEHAGKQVAPRAPSSPAPTRAASSLSQRSISSTSSEGSSAAAASSLLERRPTDADAALAGLAGEQPRRRRPPPRGSSPAAGRRAATSSRRAWRSPPTCSETVASSTNRIADRLGTIASRLTFAPRHLPATVCSRRGTATTPARRDD